MRIRTDIRREVLHNAIGKGYVLGGNSGEVGQVFGVGEGVDRYCRFLERGAREIKLGWENAGVGNGFSSHFVVSFVFVGRKFLVLIGGPGIKERGVQGALWTFAKLLLVRVCAVRRDRREGEKNMGRKSWLRNVLES